jgi:CO/xanthine dehydrogenase Mo-binding subunit
MTSGRRRPSLSKANITPGAQEQLYIENNGAIAIANAQDGVTVWGSMQCPYYVHKALVKLFALAEEKIRVIQTETGGGLAARRNTRPVGGSCGAALVEVGQAGEDDLRPGGRYGRDHEATSLANAA